MKNVTSIFKAKIATTLLFAAATIGSAWAQNPPPGAIFDLATTNQHTGVLSNYVQFNTSFTADSNLTYVSFAFREIPDFFALDDASVKDTTTPAGEMLNDPGFEGATVGSNIPAQWSRWIQPVDVSAIGVVASLTNPGGCGPNGPNGGSIFWCDGSVEGYDALFQALATTPGDHYQVTFYLGDNSNHVPYNPGIDMLVYAGDQLPQGTEALPEPGTLMTFGSGIAGLGTLLRRRFHI